MLILLPLRRLRQENYHEFMTSLDYIANKQTKISILALVFLILRSSYQN